MRAKHFALILTSAVVCGVMIVTAQQGTAVTQECPLQAARILSAFRVIHYHDRELQSAAALVVAIPAPLLAPNSKA